MAISVIEFQKRHPLGLACSTDRAYTYFANEIYNYLDHAIDFLSESSLKQVAISIAQYYEDQRSSLHLWTVFLKLHKGLFGKYMPFSSEDDALAALSNVKLLSFVLWLSISAERPQSIIDPCGEFFSYHSENLYLMLHERGLIDNLPCNTELQDYLYAESTQTDGVEVKRVLIWLESGCYLGKWYNNQDHKYTRQELDHMLPKVHLSSADVNYGNHSLNAFSNPAWPVALPAQHIYAEMIREDMQDEEDELAQAIEDIKYSKMAVHWVVAYDKEKLLIENQARERFEVKRKYFQNLKDQVLKDCSSLLSAFICFDGEWQEIGLTMWYKCTQAEWNALCDEYSHKDKSIASNSAFNAEYAKKHNGQRLFFFANIKEYFEWQEKEMNTIIDDKKVVANMPQNDPLAVFLQSDGTVSASPIAQSICSPNNPFYSAKVAQEEATNVICLPESCTIECLQYLIANNLIPDAQLFSRKVDGKELMQNNIEFFARCCRRDWKM